ncbi:MAG TPA: hybrid sensor histidine kinase/response regulator [Frateuria sp.]|uniref:ATP-binding response regulator n=1 Tax=Frateuria sp. TaxID=2211372 RepID=UPI002D7F6F8F|nr:hybrid sensor histidine kinase/response regulator [Frateuria sp.]HET6807108.1 hybrid sensor histidine kinase/response regulator [Frateuria sp.]
MTGPSGDATGRRRLRALPPSLESVAHRLRDRRIDAVVASFKENRGAPRRVVWMLLVFAWTVFWLRAAPEQPGGTLWIEARRALPWAAGLLLSSIAWAGWVWAQDRPTSERQDKIAALADYAAIFLLLKAGWNLSISLITLLPLATIVAGARFSRRMFHGAMLLSVVLLFFAAPPGYWTARPAFVPFALVLLVGLPFTVHRLLAALYAVSASAVDTRDAQARLTAMISHELRNPLNAITHASALLEVDTLPTRAQSLVHALHANAKSLSQRVRQVMDMAALDNRQLRLESKPFSMDDVLIAVRAMIGGMAAERGVTLEVSRSGVADGWLGDPGRLEQLVSNLASNAVKFTPAGGRVRIRVTPDGEVDPEGRVPVCIQVSDTGVGTPAQDKPHIFEPFVKGAAHASRGHGLGLGLFIVRGLSDAMGGRLSVADVAGGGAAIGFHIALRPVPAGQALHRGDDLQEALQVHRTTYLPVRCLIIDDSGANRDLAKLLLGAAGHAVDAVASAEEAACLIRERAPEIVFLDHQLPGATGLEFLMDLRQQGIEVPVVMLTGEDQADVERRALEAGAACFLLKPAQPHELLAAVATHCGRLRGSGSIPGFVVN